jgi:hypothetical protein
MPIDVWAQDASSGAPSYSGQDLRLTTVTPTFVGAGASLGVRSGVRPSGSGTDLVVQQQASPNMSVLVQPGCIIVQGSISSTQGAYAWALDTATTRTIAAAHASLNRTDLVTVRIRDANVDTSGGRDGDVIVITGTAGAGTPALPTDATYITLAQVSVLAAATTITTARITDQRPFTAAVGGYIPCTTTTRPLSPLPGQRIWEADTAVAFASAAGKIWNGSWWDPGQMRGYVSTDVSTGLNDTTLRNATGLAFPMEASGKYIARYSLWYTAGTTGDMKIAWTQPSGAATVASNALTLMSNVTTDLGGAVSLRGDSGGGSGYIVGGAGAAGPWSFAILDAYFECGGTAGTAQLQFAQNANDGGQQTIVRKGSFVHANRVA